MATFTEACDALTERATGTATMSTAAQAMADALLAAAAGVMGGDVVMSGTGRAVTVEPSSAKGSATIRAGGAYGLADGGRHAVRGARRRGNRGGLRTPWGPRANVKGSTSAGLGISDRSAEVLEAGKQAIRDAVGASS